MVLCVGWLVLLLGSVRSSWFSCVYVCCQSGVVSCGYGLLGLVVCVFSDWCLWWGFLCVCFWWSRGVVVFVLFLFFFNFLWFIFVGCFFVISLFRLVAFGGCLFLFFF